MYLNVQSPTHDSCPILLENINDSWIKLFNVHALCSLLIFRFKCKRCMSLEIWTTKSGNRNAYKSYYIDSKNMRVHFDIYDLPFESNYVLVFVLSVLLCVDVGEVSGRIYNDILMTIIMMLSILFRWICRWLRHSIMHMQWPIC